MQRRRQKTIGDEQDDFSFKKKREEEKKKNQSETKGRVFLCKQQTFFILHEKMQKERMKNIFSQREETFFSPNNLAKLKEGETCLGRIFQKKKSVVKGFFSIRFFLVKNI